ncbi:MAG: ATP-binding protein, partial [Polyangiaceae bacterium]
ALPEVDADPLRLRQILYNLLSNAIKFTAKGGDVTLTAKRAGKYVDVSVRDTGVGIREEDRGKLFREFEQLESTRFKATEGTGLGLALTKRLVEAHGGTIRVDSTFGHGSTFTVSLPIPANARTSVEKMSAVSVPNIAEPAKPVRASILVVENDRASRILVRDILAPRGHRVLEAESVEEALQIWMREEIDLVLTDLGIPGGGGQELLAHARKRNSTASRKIPVIATTASMTQGEEKRVLASGFDGYIGKPIETRQLGPTIESFLRR